MTQSIISISGLTFTYPGCNEPVLKNIDLEIKAGDFVAVIGSNGSGKTTLCKTLNGIIPQYITGDFEGKVEVKGLNVPQTNIASLARHVAYVYQDFESQLVRSTVYEDVIFAPMNFGHADYHEWGMDALRLLGLEHLKDRFIWELSGGQKHLAALAGTLSLKPEIIIVDEPAAQLDPVNAARIYDKLKALNRDYGKTVIVIEHHTEFIADYCDSAILMDKGAILWHKPVKEALNRLDELKKHNIYPPQVTQAAAMVSEVLELNDVSRILPVKTEESKAWFKGLNIAFNSRPAGNMKLVETRQPVVEFKGVNHSYKTMEGMAKEVLSDVELTVYEGDRVVIAGSNGAGKSTLLKLISGLIKPQTGVITVCACNTRQASPEILAEKVSYIFQNPEEMFIDDSIRRDIEYFFKARQVPDRSILVDRIISGLQLEDLQDKNGRLLSGGQQRRASLAIGIACYPAVILLDEPTGSLDIASRREMVTMLEYLKERIKTVVIATHDMQMAAEWANRMIVMKGGRIIEDSTPEKVFDNPELLKSANLQAPQIVQMCLEMGVHPPALSLEELKERLTGKEGDEFGFYREAVR